MLCKRIELMLNKSAKFAGEKKLQEKTSKNQLVPQAVVTGYKL